MMVRNAVLACLAMTLSACASYQAEISSSLITPSSLIEEYRIGVDDQLTVHVWRNPELTISVPVRYDGRISLPLVGDVNAGGLTPEAVALDVESRLKAYVREPNVTVIVTQLRSHEYISRVRVTGAVSQPASLPFREGMTVLDAVLAAGGSTEFAAPNRTKLHRRTSSESGSLKVRLGDIFEDGDLSTNYALQPGDIVTVPQRLF